MQDKITFSLKWAKGSTIWIVAHACDTIGDILDKNGIPWNQQQHILIFYKGNRIHSELSFLYYQIPNHARLIICAVRHHRALYSIQHNRTTPHERNVKLSPKSFADIKINTQYGRMMDLFLTKCDGRIHLELKIERQYDLQSQSNAAHNKCIQSKPMDLTPATHISEDPLPTCFTPIFQCSTVIDFDQKATKNFFSKRADKVL